MRRALGLALVFFVASACLRAQAEVPEQAVVYVEAVTLQHHEPPPSPSPSPVPEKRKPTPRLVAAKPQPALVSTHDVGAVLACIRQIESTNDYRARNGNHWGAYQFVPSTWRSVGGSGNPAHAPPQEQDMRARRLLEREGLDPWPTPSRKCRHLMP